MWRSMSSSPVEADFWPASLLDAAALPTEGYSEAFARDSESEYDCGVRLGSTERIRRPRCCNRSARFESGFAIGLSVERTQLCVHGGDSVTGLCN